jgi:hypothetical protein
VDVGAAAPNSSALSVDPSCLVGSVVGSCGARSRGRCVAFEVFRFSLVRAVLGPVWMSERWLGNSSAWSVVPSCLGRTVVGSCGAWSRCRCVTLGCMVFASFPYKLAMWVYVCPLAYLCIGFWLVFLITWPLSHLLNEKTELLSVAQKKSSDDLFHHNNEIRTDGTDHTDAIMSRMSP